MKDIDFDELDKAVNSLMSRTKNENPGTSQAPTPSSDTSPAQNAPMRNEPDIPTTAAPISPGTVKPKSALATNPDTQPAVIPSPQSKSTQVASSRAATPASRRSGRFMDVVPKKPSTPARPTSREGVAVSPRSDMGVDAASAESSTPSSQPMPQPKPQVTEKTAPQSDWPDPIEVATAKRPPKVEKKPEVQKPEESASTEPTPAKNEESPKDQPLNSPFLPNAKVEKRPLGGTSSNLPMTALESELKAPEPDDSEAQLPAKPSDVSPETPEEFGGDVMQVEADTHMGVPKTDDSMERKPEVTGVSGQAAGVMLPKKPEPELSAIDETPTEEKPAAKPKVTERAEELTTSEPPSASGRISIPPQYKEQPSTGEKESGAIYDTSTYHQPLAHPAKKKSGWLWVLWIILILIVGAGAGAALYFLGVM